jgi:Tannase-like family of unknown function (DUF6351)
LATCEKPVAGGASSRHQARQAQTIDAEARSTAYWCHDTRTAAGGGLTGDTLKCQLKPLDFAFYPVTFTAAQQTRLEATFPTGVCDWSKPGVDERPPLGAWLDYGP